jgi:threonine aldolase
VNLLATPLPPPPQGSFASDNSAGAHPSVVEAIAAANTGHALAYGNDPWTAEAEGRIRDLFGAPAEVFLVWNGTGANVTALGTMVPPAGAVVCTAGAHVAVDEAGAPERIVGAKLITVPSADGKLRPDQLEELAPLRGVMHHAQPEVVSITQSTELGTVYSPDEVTRLCDTAHALGMTVHMDGARLANAVAALGGTLQALRAVTTDAGVDVLSFGATKAGAIGAEAVVYLRPQLASRAAYVRKMSTQLPSKMRFVAAQFNALLEGGLWIHLATHANAMAALLHRGVAPLPGVELSAPPPVNALFPFLDARIIEPLRAWSPFYDWDAPARQVRWMSAWDTTAADVERFVAGVEHLTRT